MPIDTDPAPGFLATSGTTTYPDATDDGTTTAGSSIVLDKNVTVLESMVVEDPGSANGTITIANHAGTKTIVIPILTAAPQPMHWGPYGKKLAGWTGIRAALTGTGMKVRILFRYS